MTVVFKSDVKADSNATIENFVGYKGPDDYFIYADISNNIYKKGSNFINLVDILSSPGQKKFYAISDKLGNIKDSQAGVVRRSFVPAHGVFAVMAETPNRGFVLNKNIVIPANNSVFYAAYATKGNLLINVNDVNLIGGQGTLVDPYIFKLKDLTIIPYSLDRIDAYAVCTQCVGNRVPLNPVLNSDNVSDSSIYANLDGVDKNQFSVVIRVISPQLGGVIGETSGYVPVLKFIQDNSKSLSIVKVRNVSLNIQARSDGSVKGEAQEAAPVTSAVDTYAISFNNGQISLYMNGAKINTFAQIQLPSFILNTIEILSNDVQWGVTKTSDALVNLIIYNRTLSTLELSNCLFS